MKWTRDSENLLSHRPCNKWMIGVHVFGPKNLAFPLLHTVPTQQNRWRVGILLYFYFSHGFLLLPESKKLVQKAAHFSITFPASNVRSVNMAGYGTIFSLRNPFSALDPPLGQWRGSQHNWDIFWSKRCDLRQHLLSHMPRTYLACRLSQED